MRVGKVCDQRAEREELSINGSGVTIPKLAIRSQGEEHGTGKHSR